MVGGRGEEVSVAIDVEGSEMLGREGGNFDNEMKGKVEEEGLHGLDKLLFFLSRENGSRVTMTVLGKEAVYCGHYFLK